MSVGILFKAFKPEESIRYEPLCDDFGPMNLVSITKFVNQLDKELEENPSSRLIYSVDDGQRNLTNAVFLLGSYMVPNTPPDSAAGRSPIRTRPSETRPTPAPRSGSSPSTAGGACARASAAAGAASPPATTRSSDVAECHVTTSAMKTRSSVGTSTRPSAPATTAPSTATCTSGCPARSSSSAGRRTSAARSAATTPPAAAGGLPRGRSQGSSTRTRSGTDYAVLERGRAQGPRRGGRRAPQRARGRRRGAPGARLPGLNIS